MDSGNFCDSGDFPRLSQTKGSFMPKMLIASTVLSLLAALCQAQTSPGLGLVFQTQPQATSPVRSTGDLEGTVTDATGALLPGATVTVKTAGAEAKSAVTDGA